jgi:hypothetical protein
LLSHTALLEEQLRKLSSHVCLSLEQQTSTAWNSFKSFQIQVRLEILLHSLKTWVVNTWLRAMKLNVLCCFHRSDACTLKMEQQDQQVGWCD